MKDAIVFGSLLIMLFYHLHQWYLRKNNLSAIYFALVIFACSSRMIVQGEGGLIYLIAGDIPIWLDSKFDFFGFALALASTPMFVNEIFHKYLKRRWAYLWAILGSFWAVLILLTPHGIYLQLEYLFSNANASHW